MKQINTLFLVFAFLTAFFMILIGIAIAERSFLGIIGAIVGVVGTTGLGFTYKKKLRERNNK